MDNSSGSARTKGDRVARSTGACFGPRFYLWEPFSAPTVDFHRHRVPCIAALAEDIDHGRPKVWRQDDPLSLRFHAAVRGVRQHVTQLHRSKIGFLGLKTDIS